MSIATLIHRKFNFLCPILNKINFSRGKFWVWKIENFARVRNMIMGPSPTKHLNPNFGNFDAENDNPTCKIA